MVARPTQGVTSEAADEDARSLRLLEADAAGFGWFDGVSIAAEVELGRDSHTRPLVGPRRAPASTRLEVVEAVGLLGLDRPARRGSQALRHERLVSETVTAVLAVAAYVVAIAFSLSLFLFAVSRVVSGEQDSGGVGIALAVLAGLWLLFVIGGGFFWFRLLSVGVPEGLEGARPARRQAERSEGDSPALTLAVCCGRRVIESRARQQRASGEQAVSREGAQAAGHPSATSR